MSLHAGLRTFQVIQNAFRKASPPAGHIRLIAEPLEARVLLSAIPATLQAPGTPYAPPTTERAEIDLDSSWKFQRADVAGANAAAFDDSAWSAATLPHTWNAADGQDGGSNYYRGVGWYRRHLAIAPENAASRLFLRFEGANAVADVYVNGTFAGHHTGGYTAFTFDVTGLIDAAGDNVIAVKVNNAADADLAPISADYTSFGGLYRDVRLLVTNAVHVDPLNLGSPGVFAKPSNVSAASADLEVTSNIRNDSNSSRSIEVDTFVVDAGGNTVATLNSTQDLAPNSRTDFVQSTNVPSPHLWDGRTDPYLYQVYVQVNDGGNLTDLVQQPLGFRSYSVSPDSGFSLNGKYLDLHGVSLHQDRLNKGWAVSPADTAQDIDIVKEIGATAVRLSHYPHSEQTYDLLDQSGIVAWSEIPLINQITQSTAFYASTSLQLQEMIRQNYNHPSVLFWGLFNEVTLRTGPDPKPLVSQLQTLAKTEDSTRLTTVATDANDSDPVNWYSDVTDFNRYGGWYGGSPGDFAPWADSIHRNYPTRSIGVSEFGAGASIKQHTDNVTQPVADSKFHPEEWQNVFHETYWQAMQARPFLWSKFVWNLFDFAIDSRDEGDAPGRNDKGLVTYDRSTRKDAFYYYKANWSDSPVLYLTDRRFTQRTNATTDVKVYSNLDSVTLKVNGVSIGSNTSTNRIFRWQNVSLAPGDNLIEVSGQREGVTFTDTCTWIAPDVAHYPAKVNFQPGGAAVPSGYLVDAGAVFGSRGNGFSYGWNLDSSANPRDRNAANSPDQRYDTFTHMQNGKGGTVWEMAVPNGNYTVRLVAGDPGYNDSVYKINVEGVLTVNGTPTTANRWVEGNALVSVSDGKLTVSNASGSSNNKIDFIEISEAAASPVQSPYTSAFVPPTTIQAEDYDKGGEGIAYHDTTAGNQGTQYRPAEGVDVEATTDAGGGFNLVNVASGEWLEYTLNVASAATFDVDFRVASSGAGGAFHTEVDGFNEGWTLGVPNTGGAQTWQTVTRRGVKLSAGTHVLRLVMDQAPATGLVGNFNWIAFRPATVATVTTLAPVADAFVRDGSYNGTNFGTAKTLDVKKSDAGFNRESYLKFDLTNITSISGAKLRLYGQLDNTKEKNIATGVSGVADINWSETGITYLNRPTTATALSSTTIIDTVARWYEWDVTAYLAQQKAAGKNVVTLAIKSLASANPRTFFNSREAGTNGPELKITA